MNRYFILGTDTDCGKTYVTGQLVDVLKQGHQRVLAIKPVASGCFRHNDRLVSDDVQQLNAHNEVCPEESLFWRFQSPISPHLAAAEDGVDLSIHSILTACRSLDASDLDVLLIEGAGGLMVPLNAQETWVDFLIEAAIPVILVVGMRLGCLNHALLTEAVLTFNGICCVGWIANCVDPSMMALQENIDTLVNRLSFPHLATVPFGGSIKVTDRGEYLNLYPQIANDAQALRAIPD